MELSLGRECNVRTSRQQLRQNAAIDSEVHGIYLPTKHQRLACRYRDFQRAGKHDQCIGGAASQDAVVLAEIVDVSLVALQRREVGNCTATSTTEMGDYGGRDEANPVAQPADPAAQVTGIFDSQEVGRVVATYRSEQIDARKQASTGYKCNVALPVPGVAIIQAADERIRQRPPDEEVPKTPAVVIARMRSTVLIYAFRPDRTDGWIAVHHRNHRWQRIRCQHGIRVQNQDVITFQVRHYQVVRSRETHVFG